MEYKTAHDKELSDIFAKYNLDEKDKTEIVKYLTESYEQIEQSLVDENYSDWHYTEPTTENAKNFVADICDFTIGWKYDENDIINLDKQIIKQLA